MAVVALLVSLLMQALVTATLGLSLTAVDSVVIVFIGAVLCMGAARTWQQCRPESVPSAVVRGRARPLLVRLNLWTAASVLAFFLGVAAHSAGVVFTLEVALAPLTVTVSDAVRARRLGGGPGPGRGQWVAVVALAVLGVLAAGLARGDTSDVAFFTSVTLGVVAGASAGAVVVVSHRLGESGVGVAHVIVHRFHLTWVVAALAAVGLLAADAPTPGIARLGMLAGAGIVVITVPLFLSQVAMQRLAPIAVATALSAIPVVTLAVEMVVGAPSGVLRITLAAAIVPISAILALTQQSAVRKAKKASRSGGHRADLPAFMTVGGTDD